jgi:hypothetical protein
MKTKLLDNRRISMILSPNNNAIPDNSGEIKATNKMQKR